MTLVKPQRRSRAKMRVVRKAPLDRYAAFEHDLQLMAAESRGLHGSGLLIFQILGAGYGKDLFLAAEMSSPLARSVVSACIQYIAHTRSASPGAVQCLLCAGPFAVPIEKSCAVLAVRAFVSEPTVVCCSGICIGCCTTMDEGELGRQILQRYRAVFPDLRAVPPPLAEPGHA